MPQTDARFVISMCVPQPTFGKQHHIEANASTGGADDSLGEGDAGKVVPMPARKDRMPARGELKVNIEI
ncbi:unnamed protein product [Nippostrongylus brasiliensis]|uniref:Uncharacterized protein n=1 Tax=Nippostrongylus brasiliensis TaxID=27835 RepID=A0A0N4Y4Z9_NIPBR|nr:unnamed protein product [Nippostrongylus brasiliensis]